MSFFFHQLSHLAKTYLRLDRRLEEIKILSAQSLIWKQREIQAIRNLKEVEFKVFSEWGDDGIIQFLIHSLPLRSKTFIEFGVEDYTEANTRFLLMNDNWSGLVMDGSKKNMDRLKSHYIYRKFDLVAIDAFITAENINELISTAGFSGPLGLLHIDLDGNDYWIFKALSVVDPDIVILEYNALFGVERPITVPYKPDFYRTSAHYSNLYFGASLPALYDLTSERGYDFIGCNSNGNNAYFVKKDLLKNQGRVKSVPLQQGYVKAKFKEARQKNGSAAFTRATETFPLIKGLPVWNTKTNNQETL